MPDASRSSTTDPRFLRSLDALLRATATLLQSQPYERITIASIVEAAGVTRPTFYQHFPDIHTAARQALMHRLEAAFERAERAEAQRSCSTFIEQFEASALEILEHLAGDERFYLAVLDNAATFPFQERLVQFISAQLLSEEVEASMASDPAKADLLTALGSGCLMLAIRWLREGTARKPAHEMALSLGSCAGSILHAAGLEATLHATGSAGKPAAERTL